ncbi:class II glutamine amidotransferase [Nocardia albiluteola]|uniref:class II glutamine amidotransferase n=1 Tax=Nocardia albiluteola TaxID=2842303 RepID=UPI001FDA4743|nr:class II glutamine amidotransferase [Nocardia albiluteola]
MCRHLGYLGPAAPVGEILTRGTHSLRNQAWEPQDMRGGGTINADGFGVAWWLRDGGVSRYRNPAPMWTDPAVDEVLPQLRSTAVLAAVRSATVGAPVERNANAPFTHGRWAFSHNGRIPDWQPALSEIATEFGSPPLLEAESHTDSAALWVIVRGLLETADTTTGARAGEADGAESFPHSESLVPTEKNAANGAHPDGRSAEGAATTAVATGPGSVQSAVGRRPANPAANDPAQVLPRVIRAVLARSPRSRLNLLLGDGETLWATTIHHALSVLVTDEFAVVTSEPYDDDPRWQHIPDRRLVTLRPGRFSIVTLDSEESERALA